MADILDMEVLRGRLAATRGFAAWSRRFSVSFNESTALQDLSDAVLRTLIQGDDDSSLLLYELIMGVRRLGKGSQFCQLTSTLKLEVLDTSLFLLDQLRFEVMRRLHWVEPTPFTAIPMVKLVDDFPATCAATRGHTPRLVENHPRYREYQEVFEADRPVFVRRLVPEALQMFDEEPEGA